MVWAQRPSSHRPVSSNRCLTENQMERLADGLKCLDKNILYGSQAYNYIYFYFTLFWFLNGM